MKRISSLVAAVSLMFVFCTPAIAGETRRLYVSAKAGFSHMKMDDARFYSVIGGSQTHRYDSASSDDLAGGGLGLGVALGWNFRAELEYFFRSGFSYDKVPTNDGIANAHMDLDTHSFMVHLYYDFKNKTPFTPYLSAGGGLAYHKTDADAQLLVSPFYTYQGSASSTEFAWDAGLGVSWNVSDAVVLDFGLRHVSLGEAEWQNNRTDGGDKGGNFADMSAQEAVLSVRYLF